MTSSKAKKGGRPILLLLLGGMFLTLMVISSVNEFFSLRTLTDVSRMVASGGALVYASSSSLSTNDTTATASLVPSDTDDESRRRKGRRTKIADNYRSPVASMLLNGFPNEATEREVQRHDRWVVDSQAFLHTFAEQHGPPKSIEQTLQNHAALEYRRNNSSTTKPTRKMLTIIILTVNRSVNYVAVAISTLIRGHRPDVFKKYIDLHVINIERRPERRPYGYFEDLKKKLSSFVNFSDWSLYYRETRQIREMDDPRAKHALYMEDQRIDIIRSLRLCQERQSDWCLIAEDDAVFPVNFASKFDKYVNVERYENASLPGGPERNYDSPPLGPDEDNSTGPILSGRLGFIKLYVPWNDHLDGKGNFGGGYVKEMSGKDYHRHRALDLYEEDNLTNAEVHYNIQSSKSMYGLVANAYPKGRLDLLITFLTNKLRYKAHPTDVLLSYNFIVDSKLALLETHPSLVGHIGYYREHHDAGRGIGQMSTDIRFKLDDGQRFGEASSTSSTTTRKVKIAVSKKKSQSSQNLSTQSVNIF